MVAFTDLPKQTQLLIFDNLKNSTDADFEPFIELSLTSEQKQRFLEARHADSYAMIFHDLEAPKLIEENGEIKFDRNIQHKVYSAYRAYNVNNHDVEKLKRIHHLHQVLVAPLYVWMNEGVLTIENCLDYQEEFTHIFYRENYDKEIPAPRKPENMNGILEYMRSVIDGNM